MYDCIFNFINSKNEIFTPNLKMYPSSIRIAKTELQNINKKYIYVVKSVDSDSIEIVLLAQK